MFKQQQVSNKPVLEMGENSHKRGKRIIYLKFY